MGLDGKITLGVDTKRMGITKRRNGEKFGCTLQAHWKWFLWMIIICENTSPSIRHSFELKGGSE